MAGNRDEFHARPTAALAPWTDAPGIVGGRDLRSGGSWAAADHHGRMAVVTNVRDPRAAQSGESRGALVGGFLHGSASAADQADRLQALADQYPPFNLLLADADTLEYLGNHPLQRRRLGPGVHGLSNGALDAPWPKTQRLMAAMQRWTAKPQSSLEPLWTALGDTHVVADAALPDTGIGLDRERWLATAFIRGAEYGTRASTLLLLDHAGRGQLLERRFGPMGHPAGESGFDLGG